MGESESLVPSNFQKYGVPFFSVAWVPNKSAKSEQESRETESDRDQSAGDVSADDKTLPSEPTTVDNYYLVFAGGGGEGRSGISNAVIVAHFDMEDRWLSDQPVSKCGTGSDCPYRMVIHPAGDGVICSMGNSCRLFEWNCENETGIYTLGLKLSEEVISQFEDVGQQLALAFNSEGSILAIGGEDGNLRVFKWPSMEIILNEPNAHTTVKDLHFSPDGKYLASVGGPCRVWDVTSSTVVASLTKENDEVFTSCRFSLTNDKNMVLHTAARTGRGGDIVTWNSTTWKRISSKFIVHDNFTAFDVSADGKLIACGTNQGDVLVLNSTSMRVQQMVKKAHLGFVTALSFSPDSRALASASMDSSARVTMIEEKKTNGGMNLWVIIFIMFLAIAAYFIQNNEILELLQFPRL